METSSGQKWCIYHGLGSPSCAWAEYALFTLGFSWLSQCPRKTQGRRHEALPLIGISKACSYHLLGMDMVLHVYGFCLFRVLKLAVIFSLLGENEDKVKLPVLSCILSVFISVMPVM